MEPADLPAAASTRWDEAVKYFASDAWERWLKDQHRNDLAASLVQIRTQQKDRNLALDAFLRVVDPSLPPPQLALPVKTLKAGVLPWHQKMELDLEIRNTGGGCLVAEFANLPAGVQARPQTAVVRDRLVIRLTLDSSQIMPSAQPLDLPVPLEAGRGGSEVVTIKAHVPEPAVVLQPAQLDLGRGYRGQRASNTLVIANSGKSPFSADLSRIHESPARLLGEANRILAAHMDSRSFVTMTYAVVDTVRGSMRYARAGHNPIIHFDAAAGRTRLLTPPGLGLGLDKRGDQFEEILEEAEVPLGKGDVFLFFTDGLSEAMNLRAELFGEDRVRTLLEQSESWGTDDIKEHILAGIRSFVGEAAQHDDMTLVLLKVA